MKLLLTSAGLNNNMLADFFVKTMDKDICSVKALFIITAANNPDAIEVLPKCLNDLLKVGVVRENITVYDMHKGLSAEELQVFDVVYICGGSTGYLLKRMKETGFDNSLLSYAECGGYILGVSAGSIVLAGNTEECLGFLDFLLHVHCEKGNEPGVLNVGAGEAVCLTNDQAIWFDGINAVIYGTA